MGKAIMANIDKMAVMTWLYRVMKSTNIGVYAKNRKNVSYHRKQNWKICIGYGQNKIDLKIMAISFVFWPQNGH